MKIGILTFHEGINHGGYFQAYCLYSHIASLGHDVELINYKNKTHYKNEKKAFLYVKNPFLLISNILKILKFRKAQKKMPMSKFTVIPEEISFDKYDAIFVGADIVWDYQASFTGGDSLYFGDGIQHPNLNSYAPSCGSADFSKNLPNELIEGLKGFSNISVRDVRTQQMVKKHTDKNVELVVDPAFLYDPLQGQISKNINDNQDYILVYAYQLEYSKRIELIEFAKENKLKIISIGYTNKWADVNYVSIGPFEWLEYIKQAKYVVTSTFHGALFSIKYEKNFAVEYNENIEGKLETTLVELDLKSRVLLNGSLAKTLKQPIEYKDVNKVLDKMILLSKNYITTSIQ